MNLIKNASAASVALGIALTRQRKNEAATEVLSRAVYLEPRNLWARKNLGVMLLKQENPQGAVEHLASAVYSDLIALENTPAIHHVVVCTLCSCYPWNLLGLPPTWYKSTAYRSRVVIDPRSVLREFGLELDETVEIRVMDSNAEVRYLIIPERPPGTENLAEEELAALISRDAMIGVAKVLPPTSREECVS